MTINGIRIVIGAGEYNSNPGWEQTQEEDLSLLSRKQWEEKFEVGSYK